MQQETIEWSPELVWLPLSSSLEAFDEEVSGPSGRRFQLDPITSATLSRGPDGVLRARIEVTGHHALRRVFLAPGPDQLVPLVELDAEDTGCRSLDVDLTAMDSSDAQRWFLLVDAVELSR